MSSANKPMNKRSTAAIPSNMGIHNGVGEFAMVPEPENHPDPCALGLTELEPRMATDYQRQ
jgi:hypothetical protein